MSAFMKAQKLLGDTHDMLAQERDREQRLVHVHSEAEFKAIADLLAGGAQPSETGFHLRVADKVAVLGIHPDDALVAGLPVSAGIPPGMFARATAIASEMRATIAGVPGPQGTWTAAEEGIAGIAHHFGLRLRYSNHEVRPLGQVLADITAALRGGGASGVGCVVPPIVGAAAELVTRGGTAEATQDVNAVADLLLLTVRHPAAGLDGGDPRTLSVLASIRTAVAGWSPATARDAADWAGVQLSEDEPGDQHPVMPTAVAELEAALSMGDEP